MNKFLLLLLIPLSLFANPEETLSTEFFRANEAYEKGNYAQAIKSYQNLISQEMTSGALYFNLANAHFRNAELGKAIFYYRKASELLPRDADVSFNLNYAREKAEDQIEPVRSLASKILDPSALPFTQKEVYWLFLYSSLFFWGIAIIYLYKQNELLRWLRRTGMGIFLLSLVLCLFKAGSTKEFAIVNSKLAKVYSAVGRDNVVLFTLHEGTETEILNQLNQEWTQILLADGKKGWTLTKNLITSTHAHHPQTP